MRTLCKKALALCVVFALALTCFVGTLSVSAADPYDATLTVADVNVKFGDTTATAVLHIAVAAPGINEAIISIDSTIGTIDAEPVLDETTLVVDGGGDAYVDVVGDDFSKLFLSAREAETATDLNGILAADITVVFTLKDGVKPGTYPINIVTEGVKAADKNETVVNLVYTTVGNFIVVCDHANAAENVTTAPTCTEPGVKTFTCACGETWTEAIEATGKHEYTYVSDNAGKHTSTCTVGGETATEDCADNNADNACDKCGYVMVEEEVSPIEIRLINGGNVKGVIPVDTIDEALEIAAYYVSNKYEGVWVDPTIALNEDLVLTADIYVSTFTTLDLGDYEVIGDYDICLANDGVVKANYELADFAANPLVDDGFNNGVYSYTSKLKLNIASRNLNLGDKIKIIFTGKATEKENIDITYSLKYYQGDDNVNYTIIDELEENTLSNTTRTIKLLTEGIVAQKMGVVTHGMLCAKTTVGGIDYYVYSDAQEYSVRHYANNTYSKTNDAKLKKLLATMLNYGASAQLAFNFNTDDLVNNVDYLTEADKQLPDIDWSADEQYLLAAKGVDTLEDYIDNLSIAYAKSCTLELTDGADIRFTITNVSSEHTYKLAVWSYKEYNALLESVNGDLDELEKLLTLDNCNKVVDFGSAVADGKKFKATASFAGIPVKKFSDTYVLRPVEIAADGSCSYDYLLPYSVTQYCSNTVADISKAPYHDICKRIAVYADAARDFYDNGYIIDSEG